MVLDPSAKDEGARCGHRWGGGPQCCLEDGHGGPHLFRCAASGCPGRPFPASQMRHPYDCGDASAGAGEREPEDYEVVEDPDSAGFFHALLLDSSGLSGCSFKGREAAIRECREHRDRVLVRGAAACPGCARLAERLREAEGELKWERRAREEAQEQRDLARERLRAR